MIAWIRIWLIPIVYVIEGLQTLILGVIYLYLYILNVYNYTINPLNVPYLCSKVCRKHSKGIYTVLFYRYMI